MQSKHLLKRTFYIFKCRFHVARRNFTEKILKFLAKHGFIVEHKVRKCVNLKDTCAPTPAPDIETDRYVFSVSYVKRLFEYVSEYWFETKKGKRIFTVWDERFFEHRLSYRAELQAFFAHFSPHQRLWVRRNSPMVILNNTPPVFDLDPTGKVTVTKHHCNFNDCRYAFEFQCSDSETSIEVLNESYRVLSNGLMSKVSEINKTLTGVDFDGDLVSPYKTPLSENVLCRKCGLPVFASAKYRYSFMCLEHGELEFRDTEKVDPIEYKRVLENTTDILERLISKFECPQDSNL